jgi:predicted ATP pyrophosphatase (TIGR00289 family)
MRLAALCSGGKDSAFALWLAAEEGHDVKNIVAMIPMREDSWMYHVPNIRLVDFFAKCAGIPLVKAETSGEREKEIEDLKRVLRDLEVEGVVSGAVASTYQKTRVDKICRELGLKSLTPLWGRNPVELLKAMLEAKFEVIITSVAAEGFDESWLGRKLDEKCVEDLIKLHEKFKINISAEGGEYETLVLDAPFFGKRIKLLKTRRIWQGTRGFLLIEQAEVVEK